MIDGPSNSGRNAYKFENKKADLDFSTQKLVELGGKYVKRARKGARGRGRLGVCVRARVPEIEWPEE